MSRILFTEEQRMNILWVNLLMGVIWVGILVFFGFAFYTQFSLGKPFGDKPVSDIGMISIFLVIFLQMAGLTILLYFSRLITEVRENGIFYRYPPFIAKYKQIDPAQIGEYGVRQYKPIKEFGGWGIKTGSRKYGRGYTISGDTGLQLVFKDGKKVLIGTQRPEALKKAMDRMMNRTID
jgi:hypothetical protein